MNSVSDPAALTPKEPVLVLRPSYTAICQGSLVAGALLSRAVYRDGCRRRAGEPAGWRQALGTWERDLLGLARRKLIRRELRRLELLGYLRIDEAAKGENGGDRYQLDQERVAAALEDVGCGAGGATKVAPAPHASGRTPHASGRTPHASGRTPHASGRTPLSLGAYPPMNIARAREEPSESPVRAEESEARVSVSRRLRQLDAPAVSSELRPVYQDLLDIWPGGNTRPALAEKKLMESTGGDPAVGQRIVAHARAVIAADGRTPDLHLWLGDWSPEYRPPSRRPAAAASAARGGGSWADDPEWVADVQREAERRGIR